MPTYPDDAPCAEMPSCGAAVADKIAHADFHRKFALVVAALNIK